jgi:DNA-directed RNA polymerase beta' subunit
LNSIEKAGFTLDKETYSAAADGQIANGRFSISNVADSEMQLQIGWQNSYNKQLTLKFAIGTRIFICQNGCVSGDFGTFKKKHVGEIQSFTPQAITDYIKSAGETFTLMQKQREQMKQVEITKRVKAELIGRMMLEEQFITSTQLNIMSRELKAPTHDYGAKDSMWELYNYTTFAMKESHPANWMDSHIKAHRFFVDASGLHTPKDEVPVIMQLEQLELF